MSQIIYLNQVHIEFGALSHLQNSCVQHKIDHALIVTDPGIKQSGYWTRYSFSAPQQDLRFQFLIRHPQIRLNGPCMLPARFMLNKAVTA